MKKYDLHNIMKNAHIIRRSAGVSLAVALKSAWATEKAMMAATEAGKATGFNYKVHLSEWVKYDKNRTYISARIYTNAWHLKREISIGYVDNLTGDFFAA